MVLLVFMLITSSAASAAGFRKIVKNSDRDSRIDNEETSEISSSPLGFFDKFFKKNSDNNRQPTYRTPPSEPEDNYYEQEYGESAVKRGYENIPAVQRDYDEEPEDETEDEQDDEPAAIENESNTDAPEEFGMDLQARWSGGTPTFSPSDPSPAYPGPADRLLCTLPTCPLLSNVDVTPGSGTSSQVYTFRVTYKDNNDGTDAPEIHRVWITYNGNPVDAVAKDMTKISGDYATGAVYEYETYFPIGSYQYQFQFKDPDVELSAWSLSNMFSSGPSVRGSPPTLSSGTMTPTNGSAGDTFTYRVKYKQYDGKTPTTYQVNLQGTKYSMHPDNASELADPAKVRAGVWYEYQKAWTTAANNKWFYFEFSLNGIGASTHTIFAPTVDPGNPVISSISAVPNTIDQNNIINMSATVTDNTAVDDVKFKVGNGVYQPATSNSGDVYWYTGASTASSGVHTYIVYAKDDLGFESTRAGNYTVRDNTPPVIVSAGDNPDPVNPGDKLTISAQLSDNIIGGMDTVIVDINGTNYTMQNTRGLAYEYDAWNTNVQAGTYSYIVYANDTSGNWAVPVTGQFVVNDVTGPTILNVQDAPDPVNQGGVITIVATVTDDFAGVNSATVEIAGNDYPMNLVGPDTYEFSGWNTNVAPVVYTYTVKAEDNNGNSATLVSGNFTVNDNTPPVIVSISDSPDPVDQGAIINLTAEVTDDGTVQDVEFSVDGLPAQPCTGHAGGDLYWYILADTTVLGPHSYTVYASDTAGNNAAAQSGFYTVSDITPPDILLGQAIPDPVDQGNALTISAMVTDDLLVDSVLVEIDGNNYYMNPVGANNYEFNGWDTNNPSGLYTFTIHANDTDGNNAVPFINTFTVRDATPPSIDAIGDTPDPLMPGEKITIGADVSDNEGVDEIWVVIEGVNYSMGPSEIFMTYAYDRWDTNVPAGVYTYTVHATDIAGNSAVPVNGDFRVLGKPTADAGQDKTCEKDAPCRFDATNSTDIDGFIVTYSWTFGDGNTSNGMVANNIYRATGVYTVNLTATDNDGLTGWDTAVITVGDTTPPATVTGLGETSVGLSWIQWNWTNPADADFKHVEIYVDGVFKANVSAPGYNTTGLNPGTIYTISTRTTDNTGNVNTSTIRDTATTLTQPNADAGPDRTCEKDAPCRFDGINSTDIDGAIISYSWDFGDGNTSNGLVANNTYRVVGIYTANLTVTDNDGLTGWDTAVITVGDTTPPATVTNLMETGIGLTWIYWQWTNPVDADLRHIEIYIDGVFQTNRSIEDPSAYNATGFNQGTTHTISTRTVDRFGNINTTWVNDSATTHIQPIANFTYTPANPTTADIITFNGTYSYDTDGSVVGYSWDFGDGSNTTSGSTVTHLYAANGTYTVTLTATDNDRYTGVMNQQIGVLAPPNQAPVADAGPNQNVNEGQQVTFNGTNSTDADGTIIAYNWTFGDGNTGNGNITTHTYGDNSTYTVTLNVTDDGGNWSTDTMTVTVNNVNPTVEAGANRNINLSNPTVTLTGNFTDPSWIDTHNATWDWDDLSTSAGNLTEENNQPDATGTITNTHTYTNAGTYNVTLTVDDDDHGRGIDNLILIVADDVPPATVTGLGETSTSQTWIQWNWTNPIDADFNHTEVYINGTWQANISAPGYNATGLNALTNYWISTKTTDNTGNINTTWVNDSAITLALPNIAPVADAGSDQTCEKGIACTLNGTNSTDADGTIIAYNWTFGDGNNGTGNITTHTYTATGAYTANLTVTDDDDATDWDTALITVVDTTAPATVTGLGETSVGLTWIQWNWTNPVDADFDHIEVYINGTWKTNTTVPGYNATGLNPDTIYWIGTRTTDNTGNINTTWVNDTATTLAIPNNAPNVTNVVITPIPAYTNDTLTGNGTYADADGDPEDASIYRWHVNGTMVSNGSKTLGSGNFSKHDNVTFEYTPYDGTDYGTAVNSSRLEISNLPPTAIIDDPAAGTYNEKVAITFNASSSSDVDGDVLSYNWTSDINGTIGTTEILTVDSLIIGTHNINLTVDDGDGGVDWAVVAIVIRDNTNPVINSINDTPDPVNQGATINITANVTDNTAVDTVFFSIDGGANATPTGQAGDLYWYTGAATAVLGFHTYTVYANDTAGNDATPASGNYTAKDVTPPATVTGLGETSNSTTWIQWNWTNPADADFNHTEVYINGTWAANVSTPGYNATGLNALTTYWIGTRTTDNTGNVNLTWVNDTATTQPIPNIPPVADAGPNQTCEKGVACTLNGTNSTDSDGTIITYNWTLGDGNNGTGNLTTHTYTATGTYTANLTVTDDDGATDWDTTTITIVDTTPPATITGLGETSVGITWIQWNWTNPADADFNHTEVYINGSWTANVSTPGYNATGLNALTTYWIGTRTTDNTGNVNTTWVNDTATTLAAGTNHLLRTYVDSQFYADTMVADGAVRSSFVYASTNLTDTIFNISISNASVIGRSTSINSTLVRSTLLDSTLEDGYLEDCYIDPSTVKNSTLHNSTIINSTVINSVVNDSYIKNSTLENMTALGANVTNGILYSGIIIYNGTTYNAPPGIDLDDIKTPPVINSIADTPDPVKMGATINITANVTDADGGISAVLFSIDGAGNVTPTGNAGDIYWYSFAAMGIGAHTYDVSANDTAGNWAAPKSGTYAVIPNVPPVANFSYTPANPTTADTIQFNASNSTDSDGNIVSYNWTFGDGINGTGLAIGHNYPANGTYNVTLTVMDNDGDMNNMIRNVIVLNRPPIADAGPDQNTNEGSLVMFNGSNSTDSDGNIVSYNWTYGDGNTGNGNLTNHTYGDNGAYTVTLNVTDDDGSTNTDTLTITVNNVALTINAGPANQTINKTEIAYFNGNFTDIGWLDTHNATWGWGDGSPLQDANVTEENVQPYSSGNLTGNHTYTVTGSYTVTLNITDDDGETRQVQMNVKVLNRLPGVENVTITPVPAYTNDTLVGLGNFTDKDGDAEAGSTFKWYKNGVQIVGETGTTLGSSNFSKHDNITFEYTPKDGEDFGIAVNSSPLTINNSIPRITGLNPAGNPVINETDTQNFNITYADADGETISVQWYVNRVAVTGANTSSYDQKTNFSSAGVYNVSVVIKDGDNANDTNSWLLTVLDVNRAPIAIITAPLNGTVHEVRTNVLFNGSMSYDPDADDIGYTWMSNIDGNIAGNQKMFTTNGLSLGSHTVNLTVDDGKGGTGVTEVRFIVRDSIAPVINSINDSPDPVAQGVTLNITSTVTDNFRVDTVLIEVNGVNYTTTNASGNSYYYDAWNTNVAPGTYNYTVYANDTSGNQAVPKSASFKVIDIIAPVIANLSDIPDPVDYGAVINISADVTDNVAVGTVIVDINGMNYTMTITGGNSYYYAAWGTNVTPGTYNYTVYANDTSGNQAVPQSGNFLVVDRVVPVINSITVAPDPVTRKRTVTLTASVTDNVAVDTVLFEEGKKNYTAIRNGNIYTFTGANTSALGTFNFSVHANDTSGNIADLTSQYNVKPIPVSPGDGSGGGGSAPGAPPELPGGANIVEICNDGEDNDRDGLADCDDLDCTNASACKVEEEEPPVETRPAVTTDLDFAANKSIIKNVLKGDELTFIFKNELHKIIARDVKHYSVILSVESTPIEFTLERLETETIDIDSDGENDIEITLNSIENNEAELRITRLWALAGEMPTGPTGLMALLGSGTGVAAVSILIISLLGGAYIGMQRKKKKHGEKGQRGVKSALSSDKIT